MRIDGRDFRTIWPHPDGTAVDVIDQRLLPHRFAIRTLRNDRDAAEAIADMTVRGAPLIGAAGRLRHRARHGRGHVRPQAGDSL